MPEGHRKLKGRIAFDRTQFKYMQIADDLQERIVAGEFPIGENLPSELVLEAEYATAKMTIRNAIGVLVERGLIRVLRGQGTFVIANRPTGPEKVADPRPGA